MRYAFVIEKGPKSYGASVPGLPGCIAASRSRREVLKLIREAIELHVEARQEHGLPVPKPLSTIDYVEIAA